MRERKHCLIPIRGANSYIDRFTVLRQIRRRQRPRYHEVMGIATAQMHEMTSSLAAQLFPIPCIIRERFFERPSMDHIPFSRTMSPCHGHTMIKMYRYLQVHPDSGCSLHASAMQYNANGLSSCRHAFSGRGLRSLRFGNVQGTAQIT
jgi:hypothetical protein